MHAGKKYIHPDDGGATFVLHLTRATWCNIPEDGILRSHCRENLKSYNVLR
jgi:hypothetical protein